MGAVLYIIAVTIDILPMFLRYWIATWIAGPVVGTIVSLGPFVLSLAHLLGLPGGGWLTRREMGARTPSQRERDRVDPVIAALVQQGVPGPRAWYVLDVPFVNGYVIGTTLYVTREAIASPHLSALVAHELGHLNTLDGRLVLAARRLVFPGFLLVAGNLLRGAQYDVGVDPRTGRPHIGQVGCVMAWLGGLLALLAGGFGVRLLPTLWVRYWRGREFVADRYAAALGEGRSLAVLLDSVVLLDMATPWMMGRTHPYTEHRIDKLLGYGDGRPALPSRSRTRMAQLGAAGGTLAIMAVCMLPTIGQGAAMFSRSGLFGGYFEWAEGQGGERGQGTGNAPVQVTETVVAAPTIDGAAAEAVVVSPTVNSEATIAAAIEATSSAMGIGAAEAPVTSEDGVQTTIAAGVQATQEAIAGSVTPTSVVGAPERRPATITGSRTAPPAQDAAGQTVTYEPANVGDNDPATAWRVAGDGVGEQLVFAFSEPITVTALEIINGYAKVDAQDGTDRYDENRRVTQIAISWDGGEVEADLVDGQRSPQRVTLPRSVQTSRLVVEIVATTDHGGRDFMVISEISVE